MTSDFSDFPIGPSVIISTIYFLATLILSLLGIDSLLEHQNFSEKQKYLITHTTILLLLFLNIKLGTAALIFIYVYFALRERPENTDPMAVPHQNLASLASEENHCESSGTSRSQVGMTTGGNFAEVRARDPRSARRDHEEMDQSSGATCDSRHDQTGRR